MTMVDSQARIQTAPYVVRRARREQDEIIGNVQNFPVADIAVASYQRKANMKRVGTIVSQFDIHHMRPINLSYRDGQYYCYDGQHRLLAYQMMQKDTIPAIVVQGLTYAQEAALFYQQDANVVKVAAQAKFHARQDSGDPLIINAMYRAKIHGFIIRAGTTKDGHTVSAHALVSELAKDLNVWDFERIFCILEHGLRHRPFSGRRELVEGVAAFVKTYQGNPAIDWRRLIKVLQDKDPMDIIATAQRYHCKNTAERVAHVLVSYYNSGLRKTPRLEQCFREI